MGCVKCGYSEKKEIRIYGVSLCKICSTFAPKDKQKFDEYISEKIDWITIDTFRRKGDYPGEKKKEGMKLKAKKGGVVNRSPYGYNSINGKLVPNEDSVKVSEIFKRYLNQEISLNQLSKHYGLSVNGLKKILKNRTYLGEIKFDGRIHKAGHKPLVSPEIFYAVQRKLKTKLRPRKKDGMNRYKDLKGEKEPLKKEIELNNQNKFYKPIFS